MPRPHDLGERKADQTPEGRAFFAEIQRKKNEVLHRKYPGNLIKSGIRSGWKNHPKRKYFEEHREENIQKMTEARAAYFKSPKFKEVMAETAKYPQILPSPPTGREPANPYKGFAQAIRKKTNDGWELIDAVYEVFTRAREQKIDQLVIESATWLADRGFGRPVQVTQLTDQDGSPIAFQLWQPAAGMEDILEQRRQANAQNIIEHEPIQPPPVIPLPKRPKAAAPPDPWSDGIAADWAQDKEPRSNE